ncbi:MAG: TlpA family protein disulfide reductase [Bacteroidia bacterium]|nr:TlpA family protein disulfide reductase [Bacteroidia bacterium]
MQKKWIYALLALLGGLIILFYFNKYKVAPSIDITKLEIVTETEQPFNMTQLKGKKLIVSFYASWCGNCLEELKDINKIKQSDLNDIEVVCITDEPIEKILEFKERTGYTFLFLKLKKNFQDINIYSIPVTYIVNEKLEVVEEHLGYVDWTDASTLNHIKSLY